MASERFAGGELVEWLVKLEKSLPSSAADGYAVGTTTSYADVTIWQLLRDTFPDADAAISAEKKSLCTKLPKIADRISKLPAVKNWLAARPKTMF